MVCTWIEIIWNNHTIIGLAKPITLLLYNWIFAIAHFISIYLVHILNKCSTKQVTINVEPVLSDSARQQWRWRCSDSPTDFSQFTRQTPRMQRNGKGYPLCPRMQCCWAVQTGVQTVRAWATVAGVRTAATPGWQRTGWQRIAHTDIDLHDTTWTICTYRHGPRTELIGPENRACWYGMETVLIGMDRGPCFWHGPRIVLMDMDRGPCLLIWTKDCAHWHGPRTMLTDVDQGLCSLTWTEDHAYWCGPRIVLIDMDRGPCLLIWTKDCAHGHGQRTMLTDMDQGLCSLTWTEDHAFWHEPRIVLMDMDREPCFLTWTKDCAYILTDQELCSLTWTEDHASWDGLQTNMDQEPRALSP